MQDFLIRQFVRAWGTKWASSRIFRFFSLFAVTIIAAALIWPLSSLADESQPLEKGKDYTIAVFLSSQEGTVASVIEAIKHFSKDRIDSINASGGIKGHKVRLQFLDDHEDENKTVQNVETALANDRVIAMLGIWNSTRGAKVVDRIGKSGIPLISEISLNAMFADYKTIFTLTRSVDDETKVFKRFVQERYLRPAFVGLEGDLYTGAFEKALQEVSDHAALVATHWISNEDKLNEQAASRIIADLKEKSPDMLCLSIGSARGSAFLQLMIEAGIDIPIFVAAGSVERILKSPAAAKYKGELYQITDGVPHVDNERLAQLARSKDFAGRGKGFGRDAIGYGVRYGDLLAMIAEAANTSSKDDVASLRRDIGKELLKFSAGRKVFRGLWQDWSFTPNRSSAETPLMVWRPIGHNGLILSPTQYLSTLKGLNHVPVIYVNLDVVRIFRIDSSDKSFHAEFYFSMSSDKNIDIKNIEFTNAYRGQLSNQPLINIREIHGGQSAIGFDSGLRLYKVSGKFMFDPDLRNFPFDRQQFSISFQPVSTASPFFIQPPKAELRDKDFMIDGWTLEDEYVGSNQDIISIIQNYVSDQKIIPFYKFNYTWIVKRLAVDYYLRVVLPLLFILIVAYFSIFIPNSRFESVVAIQVTSLLSTIALYLAIPKLDSETATISDQIFVFTEMAIALMIGLSILRVNTAIRNAPGLGMVLAFIQGIVFPIIAGCVFGYVLVKTSDDGVSLQSLLDRIREFKMPSFNG